MHRTHPQGTLCADDRATATTVGTAGMTALAVILLVGGALIASNISTQMEGAAADIPEYSAATRTTDGKHELSLTSGALPLDTVIRFVADGVAGEVSLQWFAEQGLLQDDWQVGQWLCISGDAPGCYMPFADEVAISVHPAAGGTKALGFLSASNAAADDIVSVTAQRSTFFIENTGAIVMQEANRVYMQVVGTEITYGSGGPEIPVAVRPSTDGGLSLLDPFKGAAVQTGMVYDLGVLQKGDEVGAEAHASIYSWSRTRDSFSDDPFVRALHHGDPVPSTPGFSGQVDVGSMLAPYAQEGFIVLDDNEVIVLYELGTTDLTSSAADFQDLVLIFTIDPQPLPSYAAPEVVFHIVCFSGVTFAIDPAQEAMWLAAGAKAGECTLATSTLSPEEQVFLLNWNLFHLAGGDLNKTLRVVDIDGVDTLVADVCYNVHMGKNYAHTQEKAMADVPSKIKNGRYAFGSCDLVKYWMWQPEGPVQGFIDDLGLLAGNSATTQKAVEEAVDAALEEAISPSDDSKGNKGKALGKLK